MFKFSKFLTSSKTSEASDFEYLQNSFFPLYEREFNRLLMGKKPSLAVGGRSFSGRAKKFSGRAGFFIHLNFLPNDVYEATELTNEVAQLKFTEIKNAALEEWKRREEGKDPAFFWDIVKTKDFIFEVLFSIPPKL